MHFQRSTEGIAPQINLTNNRQRNIVQQNQPRQQENLRHRQKRPRSRQRDHTRRNSGEHGPQPLANDSG